MQSSTAIAMRALVMLIVLISVPLFAIFGKSLPDVLKGLLEGRGLVLGPPPGAESGPTTPLPVASNSFGQPGPYRAAPEAANPTNSVVASSVNTPANPTVNPAVFAPGNGSSVSGGNVIGAVAGSRLPTAPIGNGVGSMPPGFDATTNRVAAINAPMPPTGAPLANNGHVVPAIASTAQPASFLAMPETPLPAKNDSASRDINMARLAAGARAETPYASKTDLVGGNVAKAAPAANDEKFQQAETRLRELGATHYMLETWGPDNNRYRFVCKMAIGGNAEVNRYFQAVDDDPMQAMETVLRQVEEWRSRPQPQ